jgi:hypothetical protein
MGTLGDGHDGSAARRPRRAANQKKRVVAGAYLEGPRPPRVDTAARFQYHQTGFNLGDIALELKVEPSSRGRH